MRQSVNVQIRWCSNVLMCSTKLSKALPPSKFYRFLGRKRFGITPFFKTSKQLFQPRFHLSVSPDCKMCVRVTNTGKMYCFDKWSLGYLSDRFTACDVYKGVQVRGTNNESSEAHKP